MIFWFILLILNEDRHTSNMGLIKQANGKYRVCPIFDNGAAFMSDTTMSYPLTKDVLSMIEQVDSKTFSTKFNIQQEAIDELNNNYFNVTFNFSYQDVIDILEKETYYSKEIKDRLLKIIWAN